MGAKRGRLPHPDEVRRAARALTLGAALGLLLALVGRPRGRRRLEGG